MPRKTAAQKAADEAAAAAEARRHTELQRLKWVAVAIIALALFAGGYAAGQSNAEQAPEAFVPFVFGDGFIPFDGDVPPFIDGPRGSFEFDVPGRIERPRDRVEDQRLRCEIVERDGRVVHLVCESPGVRIFPDDPDLRDDPPVDERPSYEPGFMGVGIDDTPRGVVVVEMLDDSPAADAGIEVGDVIVGFGDVQIETADQFAALVADAGAGTVVPVTVRRFDARVTVEVVLGGRPE